MAGKNNKKGRGSGGSVAPKGIAAAAPANTIAADPGTRGLRSWVAKRPSEARNERVIASTGRMSPSMAAFSGRTNTTGDFYRPGTGNKYFGTATRSGNRVSVTPRDYPHKGGGTTGGAYSYRIADQAGPRPVGARTVRRRLKG